MKNLAEEQHIVSREKENEVKQAPKNKSKKPDKRQLIFYAAVTLIAILILMFTLNTLSPTQEKTTELVAPESETDKYNTKLQALDQEKNNTQQLQPELTETMTADESNKADKEQEELQQNIKNLERTNVKPIEKPTNSTRTNNVTNTNQRRQTQQRTTYRIADEEVTEVQPLKKQQKKIVPITEEDNNDFFTSKKAKNKQVTPSLIYACIHTDQSLKDGSRIKMRLTKNTEIDDNIYPINTILYGTAKIQPNRLIISINKVNQTDVKLTVYDAEDSNVGIYVETPQLNQLLKKELQTEVTREEELSKIPFSQTLRNLFNKKIKEEQIEVLNNYKIIIKNEPLDK